MFSSKDDERADDPNNPNTPKITAMTVFNPLSLTQEILHPLSGQKVAENADTLALGFSNGVLLLYDTIKQDVVFKSMSFVKGKKPIESLKTVTFQVKVTDATSIHNTSSLAMSRRQQS